MYLRALLKRFGRNLNLRLINLLALTIVFLSCLVSAAYLKYELGFDDFFPRADRIVRLHFGYDGEKPDGRIYTPSFDHILDAQPEIEDVLKLSRIMTTTVSSEGTKTVVNDMYVSDKDFFSFFPLEILHGDAAAPLKENGDVAVSRSLAVTLFGETDVVGRRIDLSGRQWEQKNVIITAVYEDFPDNSHMGTGMIQKQADTWGLKYYYLMLAENTDRMALARALEEGFSEVLREEDSTVSELTLMPLRDIHLHNRVQRELKTNGNIQYIYLVAGVNILLIIIVLFNQWLNSQIIYNDDRRFYSLLAVNGASGGQIMAYQLLPSFATVITALALALTLSLLAVSYFSIPADSLFSAGSWMAASILAVLAILASALPYITDSLKRHRKKYTLPVKNHPGGMRLMPVLQYAIAIFMIMVAAGIQRQIGTIGREQAGAGNPGIIVMNEQPAEAVANYKILKEELLKHPSVESVTGAMQVPGAAVRDMIWLYREVPEEGSWIPLMAAGEDFIPFFGINLVAGSLPKPPSLSYGQELMFLSGEAVPDSGLTEEVLINRSAARILGFENPVDAVGQIVFNNHSTINYISRGVISGVTEDFIYTNVYETATPLAIYQRFFFVSSFLIKFSPGNTRQGLQDLNEVWNRVNPDYPLTYSFLEETYKALYHNEIAASTLMSIFSAVALAIILTGLVVFTSFMVRTRTREIAVRKICGASPGQIARLVNSSLYIQMLVASAIAVPAAILLLRKWQENFAYKSSVGWMEALIAIAIVGSFSLLSTGWISAKAARINPADTIKKE